jgi:hypothetical protein
MLALLFAPFGSEVALVTVAVLAIVVFLATIFTVICVTGASAFASAPRVQTIVPVDSGGGVV